MDKITFIPQTNAVSAVIAEATGMPIIGELMAFAGLDQENENEPEEPSAEQ